MLRSYFPQIKTFFSASTRRGIQTLSAPFRVTLDTNPDVRNIQELKNLLTLLALLLDV